MGTVKGSIKGVLADTSVLLADYRTDTVSAWKNGAYSKLYSSPDLINVAAIKDSVWVTHGDHFGRIENGALCDRQEGYAILISRTAYQLVFLVRDHSEADEFNVLLVNDMIHSYAYLGRVPLLYGLDKGVEFYTDHVVYWGNGRHVLSIPADMSSWTSYEH